MDVRDGAAHVRKVRRVLVHAPGGEVRFEVLASGEGRDTAGAQGGAMRAVAMERGWCVGGGGVGQGGCRYWTGMLC